MDDLAEEFFFFGVGIGELCEVVKRRGDDQLVEFLDMAAFGVFDGYFDFAAFWTLDVGDFGVQDGWVEQFLVDALED